MKMSPNRISTHPACLGAFLALFAVLPPGDASAAPGDLDGSFGTGGKVTTSFTDDNDQARAVALQPDGKIVTVGYSQNVLSSDRDFAVARHHANGTLDSAFGTNGKVITAITSLNDQLNAVSVQPDGKIIAAGWSGQFSAAGLKITLVRYTSDGALDTGFGTGGIVTTTFPTGECYANCLALQSDGKIVVAGANGSVFAVVRYLVDGSLDVGFGSGGKVTVSLGSSGSCDAVLLQPDGKILLTGSALNGSNYDFGLVRLTSTGSLDTTFDTDGKVLTAIGSSDDHARSMTLQQDGKIVVAGYTSNGTNYDFALVRYSSVGAPDTSFDSDGKVTKSIGSLSDVALGVAVQSDGKIIAAGYSDTSIVGPNPVIAVVRYSSAGVQDTSFNGGLVTVGFDTAIASIAYDLVIQSDGRILIVGEAGFNPFGYQDFSLMRIEGLTTTTTNQSGAVSTTNFIVAPTAGQAQIYSNNGSDITASGLSSIGENGVGVLNHSGGGAHSTPNLYVGRNVGSAGTYNQSAGGVTVGAGGLSIIGNEGQGTYDQTGGTHTAPRLFLGSGLNGNGTCRQRGGGLTVTGELKVGVQGVGRFEHSSGSVSAAPLTLADFAGGKGSYMLTGGTLSTTNTLVGHNDIATFTQTGGTHTVTGSVLLGDIGTGTGTYNALGGSLSANTFSVGEVGTGTLNIDGGTLTLALLKTGTGTKTISFKKGTVNATSTNISTSGAGLDIGDGTNAAVFSLGNGSHNITSGLRIKAASTLSLAGSNLGGLPVAMQGGTINGNGTVGAFTATNGSVIDPGGTSASTLSTTGNLSLALGVNYKVDLTSSGSDQLNVNGTVDLALANLSVTLRFAPAIGQVFTIVQNDGTDTISNPFFGLGDGAILTMPNVGAGGGTYQARLSYSGSSGNDITLTIFAAPAVTLTSISSLGGTSVTLNGTVNPNAYATTAQFEYGLSTSYGSTAGVTLSPNNGTTAQTISAGLSDLTQGTLYHYRLTATNAAGTTNSTDGTFTTLSNNANLSSLSASAGTFTVPFGSNTTYLIMAPYSTTSTTITPTVAASGATVKVNAVTVASGSASGSIPLVLGNNPWIPVICTAPDGVTTKEYNVVVNRAYPEMGSLDLSFGTSGITTLSHGGTEGNDADMFLQHDGKAVVVTTSNFGGSTDNIVLLRRNADGSADYTNNGTAVTLGAFAVGMCADASGRPLVVGSQGGNAVLLRYTTSGVLDSSFDSDGKVVTDFAGGSGDEAVGVAVQSDGKIVVCGTNGVNFILVRYLSTGVIDSGFGVAGVVSTDFGGLETANNIILLSDGKILVSGDCEPGMGSTSGFVVARYLANGTLDSTFGSAGKVITSSIGGENGCAWAMALQSDGKFIVGGRELNSSISFAMVRYLADGAVDTNFGSSGFVRTTFGPGTFTEGDDIVIQPDGRILIAGTATVGGFSQFAMARYWPDGSLDPSFDGDGLLTTNFSSTDAYIASIKLQPDGKIVAAGNVRGTDGHYSAAVVRYNNIVAPTVVTQPATDVTTTSAALHGTVNANGNIAVPNFRISTDQVNWTLAGTDQILISGTTPQNISRAALTGLTPGTQYYVQAQAEVGEYNVTGLGEVLSFTTPSPEIVVEDAFGNTLVDEVSTMQFGTAIVGEGMDRRITIKNIGNAYLLIGSMLPSPFIDGTHSSRFTLLSAPFSSAPVAPGQSMSFTVRYTPLSPGPESAVLHIESDDADEASFDITLSATVMSLGEYWRLQYFGTTSNAGNAANNADPDHDGLSNLLERGCYLDPTQTSTLPISIVRNGANLEFNYSRSKAEADVGTQFRVEWSTSLQAGSWSTAGVLAAC